MSKYYAIFDNQIDEIRSIGFNSTNLKDVREQLVDYLLLGNFSEEGEQSIKKNSLEELLNYYEFTLLSSSKKLSYDITNFDKYIVCFSRQQ